MEYPVFIHLNYTLMKKFVLGTSLMLLFMVCFTSCKDDKDDVVVGLDQLPTEAKAFVNLHFSAQSITKVEQEKDGNTVTGYDVTLNNGVKLDFDAQGNIHQVESNSKLPDTMVPAKILLYVANNHVGVFIKEWERRATEQEVGLSNNVDLVFDLEGNYVRTED